MTFEQSELQRLVEEIIELLRRYGDDLGALEAISSELRTMYQRIPIYSGIIASLIPAVVQPVELKNLEEGNEVTIVLKDNRIITGKISQITQDGIKLVECKQFEGPKGLGQIALTTTEIQEIRLLTRGIMDIDRPTLELRK